MSIGFFSIKEKTNDSKFKSQVELTELKGTFVDRVVERLNKACDGSRQEFEQRLQQGSTARSK